MKMKNHPIQSRFFGRVSICNAKTVGREKAIAVYRTPVPLNELEKWCQSQWYKLLEGTEWETIPKDFLVVGNYRTSVQEGWKWEAIISGIDSTLPTVWSPDGGRITKNYRRPIRKRKEVMK
jgi:hypothetical protein